MYQLVCPFCKHTETTPYVKAGSACHCASCQRAFAVKPHHVRSSVQLPKLNNEHPLMAFLTQELREELLDSAEANEELSQIAAAVEDLRSATASHQAITEEEEAYAEGVSEDYEDLAEASASASSSASASASSSSLLVTPAAEDGSSLVEMEDAMGNQAIDQIPVMDSAAGNRAEKPVYQTMPVILGGSAVALIFLIVVVMMFTGDNGEPENPTPPDQPIVENPGKSKDDKGNSQKKPKLLLASATRLIDEPWDVPHPAPRFAGRDNKKSFLAIRQPMVDRDESGLTLSCTVVNNSKNRLYPGAKVILEIIDINQRVIATRLLAAPCIVAGVSQKVSTVLRRSDQNQMAFYHWRIDSGEPVTDFHEISELGAVPVEENGRQLLKISFKPASHGVKGNMRAVHLMMTALNENGDVINSWYIHRRSDKIMPHKRLELGVSIPADALLATDSWKVAGALSSEKKPLARN